ncbi:uncharacterized protein [Lolium perenne]|uniref:uncharacterized protein n=1 Tax=Lolium perenne TaxID=4522 RepID=UPI0021F64355|nr:uncharacterized protein LOC127306549 [Lolium perenne]
MERDVLVSEDAASAAAAASSSFAETRVICRVCQKQFAQYTCPRCNSRYCSLTCYKGHSNQCTELFMRENVTEELKQIQPEDESKRQMLDILKRFHLEDEMESDGEDESMFSEELIQKVISGDGINLEDLSDDEMKRFRQALASGELSKMIQPWTPWWKNPVAKSISLSHDGSQLIKEVSTDVNTLSDPTAAPESIISEIPEGPESPLPSLKQLTRAEPSPLLTVHLVDILYSYCFTLRLYNGDWHSDPFGASTVALSMSKVMGEDAKPETVSESLTTCIEETCSPVYRHTGGFRFAIGLVNDIITILSLGSNALVCALCDFRRLIQAGESMLKEEKVGKTERAQSSQKLRAADRKLFFITCWAHEQPADTWSSLAHLVEVQKASLEELDNRSGVRKAGRKDNRQSKVLIEEV